MQSWWCPRNVSNYNGKIEMKENPAIPTVTVKAEMVKGNEVTLTVLTFVAIPFDYAPYNAPLRYKNQWIVRSAWGGRVIPNFDRSANAYMAYLGKSKEININRKEFVLVEYTPTLD